MDHDQDPGPALSAFLGGSDGRIGRGRFVRTGKPAAILDRFLDVGLPYLTLGQPLTTLSGGERQRIKLVARLRDDAHTYVLDEPTTGMHLADTANLIDMLHRLVERGRSVVAIEHNLAVMTAADWIIDVGPGAGHQGGDG